MIARTLLLDRDGTLVVDRPGNRDARAIALMPTARAAVEYARAAGMNVGVVTNQPGIAAGTLTQETLARLHDRVEELAGPIDAWFVCPHAAHASCTCRKPGPGLIVTAARHFGVEPQACVVIGDIGADVEAAHAAGAQAILVPTDVTRPGEIAAAPRVARTLLDAVHMAVEG